jgi:hypothetical protein
MYKHICTVIYFNLDWSDNIAQKRIRLPAASGRAFVALVLTSTGKVALHSNSTAYLETLNLQPLKPSRAKAKITPYG